MKRRTKLLTCGLGLLLIAGAVPVYHWWTLPPPGLSVENIHRLRRGMSKAQVEAVFGGPGKLLKDEWGDDITRLLNELEIWESEKMKVIVVFDHSKQKTIFCVEYCVKNIDGSEPEWQEVPFDELNDSFISKIRSWLRV